MSAMDFFSQTYIAIRGPTGAPQSPAETIAKLSDRLGPSTLISDRRAAILALKGLARDHKQDVGERALRGLLEVLENDAEVDPDTALPVVETLNALCDSDDSDHSSRALGLKHSDAVLENEKAVHKLLILASQQSFYPRYATLKVLITLLKCRRPRTQQYFLTAPTGAATALAMLDDQREMMRNESLSFWEALILKNQDIQKVLAFQGAFEKLFNIITSEGGVESRVNVQSALTCVDTLLRFNSANQNYFRESPFPPLLLSLLLFPPDLPPFEPAPQEFALQFWDDIKQTNAALVVGMIGMMVASKGGKPQDSWSSCRCLLELALASNAPTAIKTQALGLLPTDLDLPLSEMTVSPYVPVPDTNGEEWDRLESSSAFDALVELVLHGEYNGMVGANRSKDSLDLRAAALRVFENFVNNDEMREAIVRSMLPRQDTTSITPLLHCLVIPSSSPPDPANMISTHFASLIFAHLIRQCPRAKSLARSIIPPIVTSTAGDGDFFIPADGGAPPQPPKPATSVEDEDPPQTLLHMLCENLSMAFISRPKLQPGDLPTRETREWDRIVINYMCLLSYWLWEDPKSVREFLEAGSLGVLVEPISHPMEASDPLIPSLCAILLGLCYEFNREPGEITRSTIHQIISRLSVDTLVTQIGSARDDVRMREVEPENFVLLYPTPKESNVDPLIANEAEIWFDWHFLDFWKSNHYAIQRAVALDPEAPSTPGTASGGLGGPGTDQEMTMLLASLREVISTQAHEIQTLQKQIKELSAERNEEVTAFRAQVDSLTEELAAGEEKRKDNEKEQEDLLVLLDELSSKRRRDKQMMRGAGLDVSEDEEDNDEEDDE